MEPLVSFSYTSKRVSLFFVFYIYDTFYATTIIVEILSNFFRYWNAYAFHNLPLKIVHRTIFYAPASPELKKDSRKRVLFSCVFLYLWYFYATTIIVEIPAPLCKNSLRILLISDAVASQSHLKTIHRIVFYGVTPESWDIRMGCLFFCIIVLRCMMVETLCVSSWLGITHVIPNLSLTICHWHIVLTLRSLRWWYLNIAVNTWKSFLFGGLFDDGVFSLLTE